MTFSFEQTQLNRPSLRSAGAGSIRPIHLEFQPVVIAGGSAPCYPAESRTEVRITFDPERLKREDDKSEESGKAKGAS
jgi:hypothetical protein